MNIRVTHSVPKEIFEEVLNLHTMCVVARARTISPKWTLCCNTESANKIRNYYFSETLREGSQPYLCFSINLLMIKCNRGRIIN